jgi:hypothetical protein
LRCRFEETQSLADRAALPSRDRRRRQPDRFRGGGLPIKEALLRLEGALPAQRSGGDLFG